MLLWQHFNPWSANLTKWLNTLKQFVEGLALKGLRSGNRTSNNYSPWNTLKSYATDIIFRRLSLTNLWPFKHQSHKMVKHTLNAFDHFVKLALKELTLFSPLFYWFLITLLVLKTQVYCLEPYTKELHCKYFFLKLAEWSSESEWIRQCNFLCWYFSRIL